jgi:hypothetical protein
MILSHTSAVAVYHSLKGSKNPRSHYCSTISGRVSVGDFVCMAPSATAPSVTPNDEDCGSITSKMLFRFRSNKTFGQVTKIYNKKKTGDDVEEEGDVFFDINLYLKRGGLPTFLGGFNIHVPVERMLVQTDLRIKGCMIGDVVGTVMVVHMDMYDRLMEGLLNVYFLDSVFEPANLSLFIKSSKFHYRSLSDLFRNSDPGYVSYPELHYNQLVEVADAACKMMCRVAASQPRTNRVHVDMLPSVWLSIKSFLLEETKKNKLEMYHDNDVVVPAVKRGFLVTPDKIIQLATVERQTEPHHKVEGMIAYTREHIEVLQSVFVNFLELVVRPFVTRSLNQSRKELRGRRRRQ